jgi:hypothetical protein
MKLAEPDARHRSTILDGRVRRRGRASACGVEARSMADGPLLKDASEIAIGAVAAQIRKQARRSVRCGSVRGAAAHSVESSPRSD